MRENNSIMYLSHIKSQNEDSMNSQMDITNEEIKIIESQTTPIVLTSSSQSHSCACSSAKPVAQSCCSSKQPSENKVKCWTDALVDLVKDHMLSPVIPNPVTAFQKNSKIISPIPRRHYVPMLHGQMNKSPIFNGNKTDVGIGVNNNPIILSNSQ